MTKLFKKFSPATLAALAVVLIGCGTVAADAGDTLSKIDEKANAYSPFIQPFPDNAELRNYENAQKLYAQPNTIIYCTTTWGNASAPLVTIPIAGKLTSSSVSYFPSSRAKIGGGGSGWSTNEYAPERRSVDGLYHGTPPPYRYGFTPGGQYVDFFNMPTLCTTALTKFQRQSTKVTIDVDPQAQAADQTAEAALARGDKAGAEAALSALDSNNGSQGK